FLGARSGRVGWKHVPLAAVELLPLEQALPLHRLEQPAEGRETLVAFVEVGFLANDRLLDQRRVQGTGRSREQAGHDLAGDLRNLLVWSGLRPSAASGASGARGRSLLVLLARRRLLLARRLQVDEDRKSTRLNSSHGSISYAV